MTLYKKLYWSSHTAQELRNKMFDQNLLDRERRQAKAELIKRTTNNKIDDVHRRYA